MEALGRLFDLHAAILPLDLQTARNGAWVSLKNYHGLTVVVIKGAGTDGDDPTFTFEQAQAVAGTNGKALSVIDRVFSKEHATVLPGTWTKETQAAASTFVPGDPSAQDIAMYVFDIEADELDVDNGFDCVRVICSDVGTNAQLGCALYILRVPKYQTEPQNLPSPIAD